MPLAAGTRLGPYEVLSPLGAGGMGEVYRARDSRLGRDVALKILPDEFASDPERLARFEREARTLGSLNHPHIAHIYGFEHASGRHVLIMELVEGEDLAARLLRGRVPLHEAIATAAQIADALEAAHDQHIIHRDVKPANVKLRADGTVKLIDFGIAKPLDIPDATAPTVVHAAMTEEGTIFGTAPYMSPEHARGKPIDKRSDIWAFGCVLYEMLCGRPPFRGETTSDIIAAILEREPAWGALPAATPSAIRRLLRQCLAKDSRRRLRDIGDARLAFDEPDEAPRSARPRPSLPIAIAIALAGAVAGVLVTLAILSPRAMSPDQQQSSEPVRSVRLHRLTDAVGLEEMPALSADGKSVAFVSRSGGRKQISQRLLAGGVPLQITKDDADHEQPRWAPDSSALLYYAPAASPGDEGTLWEVAALGGPARKVCSSIGGGDISHDGRRIAFFRFRDGHIELATAGRDGSADALVAQVPNEGVYENPRWSPDDKAIAYTSTVSMEFNKQIFIVPATGGTPRSVTGGTDLRGMTWMPDGSGIVYSSAAGSTVLYPSTYNLRAIALDGSLERQLTFGDVSYAQPDMRIPGMLVATRTREQSDIWKFPVTGSPQDNTRAAIRITRQTGAAQTPSVSPDNTELVYLSDSGGHGNLWVARTDGSDTRQLTFERDPAVSVGVPVWSSRGDDIAFILTRSGTAAQWLINRDGSRLRQFVPSGVWASWSADGQSLYYVVSRDGRNCIQKMAVTGGPPVSVRCDGGAAPVVSADGSTMYFVTPLKRGLGGYDWEVRQARPENGPSEALARISGSRVPVDPLNINLILSPDGTLLAVPLLDGPTTNLWALPTSGGALRPLTDFGDRAVVIARRISWSPDGKYLYAAVADTDADVVLLEGLVR